MNRCRIADKKVNITGSDRWDNGFLTKDQRMEEVARHIFNKLEARLHKAIQDMVVRMLDEADTQAAPVVESGTSF